MNILFFILALAFCTSANGEDLYHKEAAFRVGETAKYNVYYNLGFIWIHAGDVIFTVKEKKENGENMFFLQLYGYTKSSFDRFYCIRDTFEVTMSQKDLHPYQYREAKHEDSYYCDKRYQFNWNSSPLSAYLKFTKKGKVSLDTTITITNDVLDLVSTCYRFRSLSMSKVKKGQVIPFKMLFDDEIYNLGLTYKGTENIKLKNKTKYKALKFAPKLITGELFESEDDMVIYVSNDMNHVPLYIETKIKVGSIKVMLESVNNTKVPMSSLLK